MGRYRFQESHPFCISLEGFCCLKWQGVRYAFSLTRSAKNWSITWSCCHLGFVIQYCDLPGGKARPLNLPALQAGANAFSLVLYTACLHFLKLLAWISGLMENITSLHHYPFGPSSAVVEDRSTPPVLVFLHVVAQKRLEPVWASGIWRCFMYLQECFNSELEASPCCRLENFGNTNTTGLRMQMASSVYSWWSQWFGKHIKGCIWTIHDS